MAVFDVTTEAELRDAIFQVSNDFANGVDNGPYTININAEFLTLTQSLPMIRGTVPGDGSAQITINGSGFIDANFSGRVFFVESGAVAINNMIVLNARAQGGAGGDGASSGGAGGGGLGAGAAVFVDNGAVVTLTNVQFDGASAVGGAGGDGGALGIGFGFGSGGGGGLGGNGGDAVGAGSGGGGGYAGAGGQGSDTAAGGGGGEFGSGGAPIASGTGGGGGGGQQGGGGAGAVPGGGGGGGGATQSGDPGVGTTGGAGGGLQGGDGGDAGAPGDAADAALGGGGGGGSTGAGGNGLASGGGGGAGQSGGSGGNGGLGGGGGGGIGDGVNNGGVSGADGGAFGGGGGMGNDFNQTGGNGGFGGGGGGAPTSALAGTGGNGDFGGGGGSGTTGGAGAGYGGQGGSGTGADGGGGAALGGAIFVRDSGTLIINDGNFAGSYGVTGGTTAGAGGAAGGEAHGSLMFLHGSASVTFNVSPDNEVTFGVGGSPAPTAGPGGVTKTGGGTLIFGQVHAYTGTTLIEEGLARVDGSVATSFFTIESGATLTGGGTTGAVNIQSGGALAPGVSIGTLTIAGSLTSTLGTFYQVQIAGTQPGAFDLVNVTGTASLGNATLDLALLNFDPTPGNSFTILQAVGGVSGTFFGLADLAQFSLGDDTFQIDYTATTIVLTAVSIPLALAGVVPAVTFLESVVNLEPQILDPDVTLTGDSFVNGSLNVTGHLAEDSVGIFSTDFEPGQIAVITEGPTTTVYYEGVAIGTVSSDGVAGADLTVNFNGNASASAIDALIQSLTYFNSSDTPTPSRTLSVTVTDASMASVDADIVVNVTAQNDAPVNTVPAAPLTVAEDTDLVINGLAVSDDDSGAADITVTLTVQHGRLTVDATVSGGLVSSEIAGNGTATVTLTGDPTVISTTLAAGVIYRGDLNYNGADALTMTSNDGGASGADPGLTGDGASEEGIDIVAIDITPVDDGPPSATDDVLSSVAEDSGPRSIAAAELLANDSRAPDSDETLSIASVTNPLGGTVILNGDGSVTFTPAANFTGTASFDYVVNDGTPGNDDSGHVSFGVTAVNDAPVNTVPGAQVVNEDTNLVIAGLQVNDIDAGGGTLTTILSVASGALTVASAGGAVVGGSGTNVVTLTGTLAQINTTLAAAGNVIYRGNLNFAGADTLTMTTNDGGNTGTDPGLTGNGTSEQDTDTVGLTVSPVNDAPVLANVASTVNRSGGSAVTLSPGLSVSDVDSATLASATVHITGGVFPGDGNVLAANTAGTSITAVYNAGTETLTLSGTDTLEHYRQVLATVTFQTTSPDPTNGGLNPTRTIEWQLNDGSGANNLSGIGTTTVDLSNVPPSDFNADGNSDVLWRHVNGFVSEWQMDGHQIIDNLGVGQPSPAYHFQDTGDFNADAKADILWRHDNGQVVLWTMNGGQIVANQSVATLGNDWHNEGAADFGGDGKSDVLWRNDNGQIALWTMDGAQITNNQLVGSVAASWHVQGLLDAGGDGKSDVLLRHNSGQVVLWTMDGAQITGNQAIATVGLDWNIAGTGDFDGDGKDDILWRHDSGQVVIWQMDGAQIVSNQSVATPGNDWHVQDVGDYNGDRRSDVLWRNDSGQVVVWEMNGNQIVSNHAVLAQGQPVTIGLAWTVQNHHYDLF